jgi:hypothetical protein
MARLKHGKAIAVAVTLLGFCGAAVAQFGRGGGRRGAGGGSFYDEHGDLFVEGGAPDSHLPPDRHGTPDWKVDPHFKSDTFTFVRIRYSSEYPRERSWITDFPDSDLNFSFRLQQMTSMKVNDRPIILDLDDDRIFDYPLIYMLEVGALDFTEKEIENLRHYCANGGFLMVDDHWGVAEYENFHHQILRVFPGREPRELDISHPIFHCVFDLKEKPQVPGIWAARSARDIGHPEIIWERDDAVGAHYRAIYDDHQRMMVLICSNTDLGDGWEREGEEEWYFHQFSEKKAYPMGINIVFWAMTH